MNAALNLRVPYVIGLVSIGLMFGFNEVTIFRTTLNERLHLEV